MIDPNDEDQILAVARIIGDREFGQSEGHVDRLVESAIAWPGCYSHSKLVRLCQTAQAVLRALTPRLPVDRG